MSRGRIVLELGARLEHADLGRDRKEVLGETVVDLARDAGPLLGDGAAELGLADRPRHSGEKHAEREQPQQVAREHVVARPERREHVVEIGEDDERQGQRQPAVEITTVTPVAQPEADDRDEREERQAGRTRRRRSASELPAGPEASISSPRKCTSNQMPRSEIRTSTTVTASARLRRPVLRETKGAKAISAAPNRLAPRAAHVSTEPSPASSPDSTGATANANVPTPVAKNPAGKQ